MRGADGAAAQERLAAVFRGDMAAALYLDAERSAALEQDAVDQAIRFDRQVGRRRAWFR